MVEDQAQSALGSNRDRSLESVPPFQCPGEVRETDRDHKRELGYAASYTWGLTDINDSDDTDEPTVKNNTFSISFGYRFK